MLQKSIVLVMLAACSREDILHRRVSTRWLFYFAAAGALFGMVFTGQPLKTTILGILPGLAVLFFSVISHGSIGLGDGYLLTALGLYLGASATVRIIIYAIFLAAFYALFLYFGKKKEKKYEMPFVPFILAGFIADTLFGRW